MIDSRRHEQCRDVPKFRWHRVQCNFLSTSISVTPRVKQETFQLLPEYRICLFFSWISENTQKSTDRTEKRINSSVATKWRWSKCHQRIVFRFRDAIDPHGVRIHEKTFGENRDRSFLYFLLALRRRKNHRSDSGRVRDVFSVLRSKF